MLATIHTGMLGTISVPLKLNLIREFRIVMQLLNKLVPFRWEGQLAPSP